MSNEKQVEINTLIAKTNMLENSMKVIVENLNAHILMMEVLLNVLNEKGIMNIEEFVEQLKQTASNIKSETNNGINDPNCAHA